MIPMSTFTSWCEKTVGKVIVIQAVNLQFTIQTINNNSFRGEPPVNSEKEYFVCNKYSKVPYNASILSQVSGEVPDNTRITSEESREESREVPDKANITSQESSEESREVPDNANITSQESSEESRDSSERSEDSNLPTKTQKCKFFKLLKDLLEDLCLLKEGTKHHCQYNDDTLWLVYTKEKCAVIIEDSSRHIKWRDTVPTKHIYLNWRYDEVETLSLRNLHRVQEEMRTLDIQNEKLKDCFPLVRNKFNQELDCVQQNCKLEICFSSKPEHVFLTFVSGKGENLIRIFYEDHMNEPDITVEIADWRTKVERFFFRLFKRRSCKLSD